MRDQNHKEMIPLSILTHLGLTLMTRRNVTVLHLETPVGVLINRRTHPNAPGLNRYFIKKK